VYTTLHAGYVKQSIRLNAVYNMAIEFKQLLEWPVDFKGRRNAAYGTLLHAAVLFPLE